MFCSLISQWDSMTISFPISKGINCHYIIIFEKKKPGKGKRGGAAPFSVVG